jgi:hypothetical protein
MKTLNDQYQQIKKGKGHKGMFLTEAKRQFPNYVRTAASFHEAETILKQRGVINEGIVDLGAINNPFSTSKKESYEVAFEAFLSEAKKKENEDEKVKAIEKKPSKKVKEDADKNFDNTDEKTPDNMIFDQIMMGYYAEMKDPKNSEKTMQELKDIVFKNLAKDSIHYTREGQFGVKDLGYSVDHPGLGEPKEAKGKYKASGYGDLNENQQPTNESESKLRKVIREMIDEEIEEAYQMVSVNTANTYGAGGKRFIPSQLPFPQNIRKRFGDHMVYNPGNGTFYISDILYNNLVKGYSNQPAIKKLIMDIPPMVKQLLNKTENFDSIVELPKEFKTYHPFKAPVEKAKADKFNKAGTKQYWSEGDFLFPNLNIAEGVLGTIDNDVTPSYIKNLPISYSDDKSVAHYADDFRDNTGPKDTLLDIEDYIEQIQGMSDGEAYDYLYGLGLEIDEIVTVLKRRKPSLKESVEKDLAQINKEAEHEIIASKLEKVQALIDKKQTQISKLDEDEDMKALTDDKKVKEIQKDIKALEKAKAKLEKLAGKAKGKTKEVIDEMDDMNEDEEQMHLDQAMELYDQEYAKNGTVDIDALVSRFPKFNQENIKDYLEGYSPDMDSDY